MLLRLTGKERKAEGICIYRKHPAMFTIFSLLSNDHYKGTAKKRY
jgi:hypothetical protein